MRFAGSRGVALPWPLLTEADMFPERQVLSGMHTGIIK
jgi:hypothetical protein